MSVADDTGFAMPVVQEDEHRPVAASGAIAGEPRPLRLLCHLPPAGRRAQRRYIRMSRSSVLLLHFSSPTAWFTASGVVAMQDLPHRT